MKYIEAENLQNVVTETNCKLKKVKIIDGQQLIKQYINGHKTIEMLEQEAQQHPLKLKRKLAVYVDIIGNTSDCDHDELFSKYGLIRMNKKKAKHVVSLFGANKQR